MLSNREPPELFENCPDLLSKAVWIAINPPYVRLTKDNLVQEVQSKYITTKDFESVLDELIKNKDNTRAFILATLVLDYHLSSSINYSSQFYNSTSPDIEREVRHIYQRKFGNYYFLPFCCTIDNLTADLEESIELCLTMLYSAKLLIENNPNNNIIIFINKFPLKEDKNKDNYKISSFFSSSIDFLPTNFQSILDPLPTISTGLFTQPAFLTISNGTALFFGKTLEELIASKPDWVKKAITDERKLNAKGKAIKLLSEQGLFIKSENKI